MPAEIEIGAAGGATSPSDFDKLCVRNKEIDFELASGIMSAIRPTDHFFSRKGHTFLARGTAGRIRLQKGLASVAGSSAVSEVLSQIPHQGECSASAYGPIALGTLPFDPKQPCDLVVPKLLLGHDGNAKAWLSVTTMAQLESLSPAIIEDYLSEFVSEEQRSWSPDRFELHSTLSHKQFCEAVESALDAIRTSPLEKVVLARDVIVEANRDFVLAELMERLFALFPTCLLFSSDGFVGATPELLLRRQGASVVSQPLAGTIAHSGDQGKDDHSEAKLMDSLKDRSEHHFVVQGVAEVLQKYCDTVQIPNQPSLLRLRNVSHLSSLITATSKSGNDAADSLGLAAALHPSAAVAGKPSEQALAYLAKHERLERGRYAGPVGWIDSSGDGEWWVGIRSAEVTGSRARLFAGVGIVEGSSPRSELAETQLKLQALLAAIVRP